MDDPHRSATGSQTLRALLHLQLPDVCQRSESFDYCNSLFPVILETLIKKGPCTCRDGNVCQGRMGVIMTGLLKALWPVAEQVELSQYRGSVAAVCGHSWLHQISVYYAHDVLEHDDFDAVIRHFLQRCKRLSQDLGITLIIVFDGEKLPGKKFTDEARAASARVAAAEAALRNVELSKEDREKFEKIALRITRPLLRSLQNELVRAHYSVIQAPYEGDGQIVHLCRTGLVDVVCLGTTRTLRFTEFQRCCIATVSRGLHRGDSVQPQAE